MESYSTEKDSVETTLPWNCRRGSSPCTLTSVRVIRIIGSHITVTRIVLVCFYKSIIYIRQYLETPAEINKTCCAPQTAHSLNTGQRRWEGKQKRIDLTDVMQDMIAEAGRDLGSSN